MTDNGWYAIKPNQTQSVAANLSYIPFMQTFLVS